jgi:hypothetical protein
MEKKSKETKVFGWNKFIKFNQNILFLICINLLITTTLSKQITLFEEKDQVEFAKFIDFTIKFSEMDNLKFADYFYEHSFISVIANVTLPSDCDNKKPVIIF